MDDLTFAEALNRERLTQEEFADKLEVTARTVHNWATGASAPRLKHARAMEDEFGWDVHNIWPDLFLPRNQRSDRTP
ncbi:helix-turn-helix transcriptional regulator [Ferrimicrobium acidiphilum]